MPPAVLSPERSSEGVLLEFLAPGLIHALGNHLFAIQSCAHVMKEGLAGNRQRATILEAASAADEALDVLRLLAVAEHGAGERFEQAGVLLVHLAPLCRVPLRDRGLGLEFDHSSSRRPRAVHARTFARCVVDLLRRVAAQLPAFVEGTVRLDLVDQSGEEVVIDVAVEIEPSCLPFPMDLSSVGRDLLAAHETVARVESPERDVLRVHLPLPG